MLTLLCAAGACSVYSADLRKEGGGALSDGGGVALSGADSGGNSGQLGSLAGASSGGGVHLGPASDGGEAGDQSSVSGNGGSNGGSTGKAGAGGSAGFVGGAGAPLVDPNLIDDFEDHDKIINIENNPRRDGIWDTGNDATPGGVQTPSPGKFLPAALAAADAPYKNDLYAAHTTGKGFTMYGAYMNVSMRAVADYANTPVYDASSYKGISFIAKASASSSKAMRVRFVSGDTDPRGKKCKTTGPQTELCYNHYFAAVTLTTAWALYTLDFANFAQGGDGMIDPTIDLKEMYGLEFYFSVSNDYDLWLDDLSFTK